ncbi:DUF5011 domain-containing protein [Candidatus Peribacteria bacterium]|mgnify:FL=1|jgi:cysteine-rich repeat protein|nr:DUF5011 domain-containing protein [Candidatus Peribacteria bacterium]MBT4021390.1 DUF5011 domain-containing protein [Candidatus Peribacteria bacterium]MBT4240562.1 DUF5011 domain-containing protein [Candidatus Peribacteria bacterium]
MNPFSRKHPALHEATLAIGIFVIIAIVAGGVMLLRGQGTENLDIPIPTLSLEEADKGSPSLAARLVGSDGGVEIHLFTASEAGSGFTAPSDSHAIFNCPSNTVPNAVSVATAHGDPKVFNEANYWGYEYSGNESANRTAGRTGAELFDGRFWLSDAYTTATSGQYNSINTANMKMVADNRYYVMSTVDLRVSCIDTDEDGLNNGREDLNSNGIREGEETGINNPDTDGGTLSDLDELLEGTNPNDPSDDLPCGDGVLDSPGETCDDGNKISDDGCSDTCQAETGFTCQGAPSTCLTICGDGLVKATEQCDDGNTDTQEDGCSQYCQVQSGWSCDNSEPTVCNFTDIPILPGQAGDTVPPVITLLGDATVTLSVGDTYTDAGATALDNIDGDITGNILVASTVDTSTPGTYTFTYNVTDAAGNAAVQVSRTVSVIGIASNNPIFLPSSSDTTAPVITLEGSVNNYLMQGDEYIDPGYSAVDETDGDITSSMTFRISFWPKGASSSVIVQNIDPSQVGSYYIWHYATDTAGNNASRSRKVQISDGTPPEVTLIGDQDIYLNLGDSFIDPGARNNHIYYNSRHVTAPSPAVIATGTVDTSTSGTYTIDYNYTDPWGIDAPTITRTVHVLAQSSSI